MATILVPQKKNGEMSRAVAGIRLSNAVSAAELEEDEGPSSAVSSASSPDIVHRTA
jgi:hypothetical protein